MKSILPILLILPLSIGLAAEQLSAQGFAARRSQRMAQAPAQRPAPARPPAQNAAHPDAKLLLASAITAVETAPSINAKMRQQINLFGHQLVGTGRYQQLGKQEQCRFRLELKVQVADGVSSFDQICTGQYLWTYEDVLDRPKLERVDLVQLRRAQAQRMIPKPMAPSGAMPPGGLPRLLASLNESFDFSHPTEARLDKLSVWRVEGVWKPAMLAQMLPEHKEKLAAGQPIDGSMLPAQLPERVALTLGQDDLFPYRIEYLRREASDKPDEAGPLRSIVTLELFEVQLGGEVDPQRFVFTPGNRPFADQTEAVCKRLGLELPREAGRPSPGNTPLRK